MVKCIEAFLYIWNLDQSTALWIVLIIALLLLKYIVKAIYPWQPKWKTKQIKDKEGNIITKYYHLDE